jgi:hypothetical protein
MPTRVRRTLLCAALAAVAALGGASPGEAHAVVLRFNLEEMTETADRVFLGRCVDVRETNEEIAQGLLPVTVYAFEVEHVVKGRVPKRLEFRQLGHPSRRALGKVGEVTSNGRVVAPGDLFLGMPEFRRGDRLVLFLSRNYMGDRLTYPVGLAQGAFRVSTAPSGRELVRNDLDNAGLFTTPYAGYRVRPEGARVVFPGLDRPVAPAGGPAAKARALARTRGALPLGAFLELVDEINAARGGEKGGIVR